MTEPEEEDGGIDGLDGELEKSEAPAGSPSRAALCPYCPV